MGISKSWNFSALHAFASAVLANKMGLNSITNRALLFHHDENINWCLHHDPKAASNAAILMLANYLVNTMENENALTLDQLKYRNLAKSLLPDFPDHVLVKQFRTPPVYNFHTQ